MTIIAVNMLRMILLLILANKGASGTFSEEKQDRLNLAINEAISQNSHLFSPAFVADPLPDRTGKSAIRSLCSDMKVDDPQRNRVGCCQPTKMKVLYNVQMRNRKFELMYSTNQSTPFIMLPILNAMRMQKLVRINDVTNAVKSQPTDNPVKCSNYFNGTLHVSAERTFHKLYHAVGDNYAPAVSQIFLDAITDPEFLFLPRMQLEILNPAHPSPYMSLMSFLFSAGTQSASQLNGWCFRRVIWGPGPYVFYNDQRVAMRRLVADFARSQVKFDFDMERAIPTEFAVKPPLYPEFASRYRGGTSPNAPKPRPKESPRHKTPSSTKKSARLSQRRRLTESVQEKRTGQKSLNAVINKVWNTTITELPLSRTSAGRKPLRIVLYSRGNDGTRSLKLESRLMSTIGEKFEAFTAICCDYGKATIQQQISYAYHSDLVIGLHGAALVHGIFAKRGLVMIEFKMQYAYTSVLFPVVTDSRIGKHAVLDTREYFFVRGQKVRPGAKIPDGTIDTRLINRTTALISYTLGLNESSVDIHRNNAKDFPRDFIFNSQKYHGANLSTLDFGDLQHLLGPMNSDMLTRSCSLMILSRARREIFLSQKLKGNLTGSSDSSNRIHCPVCYED